MCQDIFIFIDQSCFSYVFSWWNGTEFSVIENIIVDRVISFRKWTWIVVWQIADFYQVRINNFVFFDELTNGLMRLYQQATTRSKKLNNYL